VVALPPSSLLTPPIEPLGNACCAADVRQNALACNPAVASITAAECILLSPNASTRAHRSTPRTEAAMADYRRACDEGAGAVRAVLRTLSASLAGRLPDMINAITSPSHRSPCPYKDNGKRHAFFHCLFPSCYVVGSIDWKIVSGTIRLTAPPRAQLLPGRQGRAAARRRGAPQGMGPPCPRRAWRGRGAGGAPPSLPYKVDTSRPSLRTN